MSTGKTVTGKIVTGGTTTCPTTMYGGVYGTTAGFLEGHPLFDSHLKQAGLETYSFIGDSGIKVSKICLGTLSFGTMDKAFGDRPGQLNESESHKILDKYVELGGNFIDTANFYPWFGSSVGESEKIIGTWLEK